ncbi:hypothetical protein E2I00_005757, partial [Balaenoptera physalus]
CSIFLMGICNMEQLSDEEIDHGAEEDSDKEDQDLDKMFGAWLGELDKLTQLTTESSMHLYYPNDSLDSDKATEPIKRSPLRQETNMANFSYRFSIYNLNEALNQGETVDLDALMADLCSIEQELSSIGAGNSKRQITETKATQKLPASRHTSKHGTLKGLSSSSDRITKPSPANYSLDDITAQLERASLSMDEAAQQSVPEDTKPSVTNQHRRTASAGTASDAEARSVSNSSRSSIASAASSMDSLDIDKVTRPQELDLTHQGQPITELLSKVRATKTNDLFLFLHDNENCPFPPPLPVIFFLPAFSQHAISLRCPSKQAKRHTDFTEEQAELTPHSYLDRETSLLLRNIAGKPSHLLTKEEQAAKLKAEKIRVALEKIKEAQVKKLVIRVHMSDDSSKTMMVDERQTVRQVLDNLMDKSHCGYSLDWSLVETISELQMERIFEDHENLVENLLNWTRDSQNKLIFMERIEKYALFKNPQNYLLGKKETAEMADRNKEVLLEECFCGSSVTVPEIEGVLWLKDDGKKSWKKRYFLLRASGIYYVPKGKAKVSRDLVCFLQLDHVNVYYGQDYRNKYKAPTDYCLVLKHPQIQKKSQYIKYLCCDDVRTLHQWVNGIRIAKYGKQLYMNYQEALKRTESAYDWTSLSSSSIKSGSSSSSIPESQSNHSNQSDSGVSDTQPAGHVRSQSIVSSIFSEAWKRGTQLEESSKVTRSGQGRGEICSVPGSQVPNEKASTAKVYYTPAAAKTGSTAPTAAPAPAPDKSGSPGKKTSKTSSPGVKKPPPTPQRNSSIKSGSCAEHPEPKRPSVDSLVSKFAAPEPSASPGKETPPPPAAPPKPGKLSLPGVLQQGGVSAKASVLSGRGKDSVVEFPSPPSDSDFPPPPPEIELPLPPVDIPAVFSGSTSPKVAVVNPQPQSWAKTSVRKARPPTRPRRNDSTRLTQAETSEQPPMATVVPQVPTSPKSSLTVQPGFLADLNRTLQRNCSLSNRKPGMEAVIYQAMQRCGEGRLPLPPKETRIPSSQEIGSYRRTLFPWDL